MRSLFLLFLLALCSLSKQQQQICPKGIQLASCKANPCSSPAPPYCNYARCVPDYCGGCNKKYYDRNGVEICKTCTSDSGCRTNEFCSRTNCSSLTGLCVSPPTICNFLYNPVCGCDGRTYSNPCAAAAARQNVQYSGPCRISCRDDSNCRADEFCKLDSCTSVLGTCTSKPLFCTLEYLPVCGCNGKTYANRCGADAAGVNIRYNRECGTGCPPGVSLVQCLVDPCNTPPPADCQFSKCVSDYCGGCLRRYYDQNGKEVCGAQCELSIDDFSLNTNHTNPSVSHNLLQLDTGSYGMGEEWDSDASTLKLNILSPDSYWYSFLGSRQCLNASDFVALRVRVAGKVTVENFKVGVLLGSRRESSFCERSDTKYVNWGQGLVVTEDASKNFSVVYFPFELFGLGMKDREAILGVEFSGFPTSALNASILLKEIALVKKDCLPPPIPCSSLKVDDFSKSETHLNLLSFLSGSSGTMAEQFTPHSLRLIPLSLDSIFTTVLASNSCFDASHYDFIRFSFTETLPQPNFRIGVIVGLDDTCTSLVAHYVPFFHGVVRPWIGKLVVDFPLELFGLSREEMKRVKSIEISGYKPSHLGYAMTLVGIDLINRPCLTEANCLLPVEDFSKENVNLLNFPSSSFGSMDQILDPTDRTLSFTIRDQSSRWVTTLSQPGACLNTLGLQAIRFQIFGNVQDEKFRVGLITTRYCDTIGVGPWEDARYVGWGEGVKEDANATNILTVLFPLSKFGVSDLHPSFLYSIEISGFESSTFGTKIVLVKVDLVKENCGGVSNVLQRPNLGVGMGEGMGQFNTLVPDQKDQKGTEQTQVPQHQ